MCGIVGYCGRRNAAPVLLEGLKKLEYRGYDSAGIALLVNGKYTLVKRKGRVSELKGAERCEGTLGVGHTRWATHGAPSERNAHPHVYGKFALVHNGIIENAEELKRECLARGESFSSETDSEVIVHLLEHCYDGNFLGALQKTAARLKGSFALAVLCTDFPNSIACARRASPLAVGKGEDGLYLASDLPAIAGKGITVYALGEGEFAFLQGEKLTLYTADLCEKEGEPIAYDEQAESPDKRGYMHFMRKEMAEIPLAVERAFCDFSLPAYAEMRRALKEVRQIQVVACGTAYHSGLCFKRAAEELARLPVEVCVASEYRYFRPIVRAGTLVIAVSQSGETADTLAAAELAKGLGATLFAVTNAPYSSLTRLADFVLLTGAGREIAVAATKSFNAQLMQLYCLAVELARAQGRGAADASRLLPAVKEGAKAFEGVRGWVPHFVGARSVFFLGRDVDYCAALEGSLKLKEITYLPSEGYPAGELKHGTLALVDQGTPVVAVLTRRRLAEKTMNAVHEVLSRGAKVFLITTLPEYARCKEATATVLLPALREEEECFSPILSVLPLQALAYYLAVALGNDPDKPRNLAKSVTVE